MKVRLEVRQKQLQEQEEKEAPAKKKRLQLFIAEQEEAKKPVPPPPKTDYERSLIKSMKKKKRGGSPNSYIEQIHESSSAGANKQNQTHDLSAPERILLNMPAEQVATYITVHEETGLPLGVLVGTEDLPPSFLEPVEPR